ncbi:MAG: exo-alpha-sialidase [Phycisphaerales bacterium]|jgi:hypothetical protein|nr:exo-alpha-sialidase [Phycisphaerales bacterium]
MKARSNRWQFASRRGMSSGMSLGLSIVAIAGSALAAPPPPYVVGPAVQANPTGILWKECAVTSNYMNDSEVVVCAIAPGGVATAVSLNAGASFISSAMVLGAGDPSLTNVPGSGRIWLCVKASADTFVTYKEANETQVWATPFSVGNAYDKPWIAVGPKAGDPGTLRFYSGYLRRHTSTCTGNYASFANWFAISDDPDQGSSAWTVTKASPVGGVPCDYSGWGTMPVVLDDGRVVVVTGDAINLEDNGKKPYVYRSIDNGTTWLPEGGQGIRIAPQQSIQAIQVGYDGAVADVPKKIDRRNCAPTIAVDRTRTPNWVYVAFYARAVPGDETQDLNTDLYICRSTDGGASFDAPVAITDSMLGLVAQTHGPDQFVPGLAVDCTGSLVVTFYDNRNDSDLSPGEPYLGEMYDVYLARITNFGLANMAISQVRLTPQTFPLADLPTFDYLGDYQTISPGGATAKCLYAAYIAPAFDSQTQTWSVPNCFVRKITIGPCLADLNLNSIADPGDFDVFVDAFLAEDLQADINENLMIDEDDYESFVESYDALEHL